MKNKEMKIKYEEEKMFLRGYISHSATLSVH